MAVVLHTNSGFVTVAPTADPAGSADVVSDGSALVTKDTAPAGAIKIVEVGWYKSVGTTSSNTQVGLYAADGATVPGEAGTRLQVTGDQASGTSAGWKVFTGLNWPVTAGTVYWLGMQQDAHSGSSDIDSATSGGSGIDVRTSQTALPNPFGGGALSDVDGMYAIYAVYQTAPTTALNSPADGATGISVTPTLNFTGTDANSDAMEYEGQVATSAFADISATNLTTGSADPGSTSATTASISPTSNKLLLATVWTYLATSTDPVTPTLSGNGLTWEHIGGIEFDTTSTSRRRVDLYRALGVSPSSGVVTIDYGAESEGAIYWVIDQISNIDISGTNGSGAVVQSTANKDESASTNSFTLTLSAFSNANNVAYGAFGMAGQGTAIAGSGFSIIGHKSGGTDDLIATEINTVNDTTVDISNAANDVYGGIAIEIKAATQALIDAKSATDAGFTAGHPFASGVAKDYTTQITLSDLTVYYWRIRAIDPTGSNTYGAWSTTRSFTTTSSSAIKTILGLAKGSVKTVNGLINASVKKFNGLT